MVFNRYAQYYDIFYQRKNYQKECNFLEQLFVRYREKDPKTILDLGCGTGEHMLALGQRGYAVTGVDDSFQMLLIAREKFAKKNVKAELFKSKLESFNLGKRFDAIVCMFSVIDYITENRNLLKTFRNIATHMKETSLFIFDFWRKEAVERYFLPKKEKTYRSRNMVIERHSLTTIDRKNCLCQVNYKIRLKGNGSPQKIFQERHCLRYFSVEEMKGLLQKSGLKILGLYPFLNINGTIRHNTWDVTIVAQKI